MWCRRSVRGRRQQTMGALASPCRRLARYCIGGNVRCETNLQSVRGHRAPRDGELDVMLQGASFCGLLFSPWRRSALDRIVPKRHIRENIGDRKLVRVSPDRGSVCISLTQAETAIPKLAASTAR